MMQRNVRLMDGFDLRHMVRSVGGQKTNTTSHPLVEKHAVDVVIQQVMPRRNSALENQSSLAHQFV